MRELQSSNMKTDTIQVINSEENITDNNIGSKFFCESCNYHCNTSFLYKQHCSTKKHGRNKNKNKNKNNNNKGVKHLCICGKEYSHQQSFKRHSKICGKEMIQVNSSDTNDDLHEVLTKLITQNQNILLENKEMRDMVKEMIPKIGNTVINNKFNLQIFLNEKCKDAINLTDFVQNLNLTLDDLHTPKHEGYISGITNIFVKGLREMDMYKRPIHCSDLKREVLYVRDNNSWAKDNNNKDQLKSAIHQVSKKQVGLIKYWEAENPKWSETDKGADEYIRMVRSVTNAGVQSDTDDKIIKTIAKEVLIEK